MIIGNAYLTKNDIDDVANAFLDAIMRIAKSTTNNNIVNILNDVGKKLVVYASKPYDVPLRHKLIQWFIVWCLENKIEHPSIVDAAISLALED